CKRQFDAVDSLIKHANQHQTGMQPPALPTDSFAALNYVGCPRCSLFYKVKGLSNHLNHCDAKKNYSPDSPPASAPPDSQADFAISLHEVFIGFRPTLTFVPVTH